MLCEHLQYSQARPMEITQVPNFNNSLFTYAPWQIFCYQFAHDNLQTERHQNTLLFEDELVTLTEYKNVPQLLGGFFIFLFHFYVIEKKSLESG